MMKIFTDIDIKFANNDVVKIPYNNVKTFVIKGHLKTYQKTTAETDCNDYENGKVLVKEWYATYICIVINQKTNGKIFINDKKEKNRYIFERIRKYDDIIGIEAHYSNGDDESIYTKWNIYKKINELQYTTINATGDLVIEIGKL